jgi:hypothetical protein
MIFFARRWRAKIVCCEADVFQSQVNLSRRPLAGKIVW